MARVTALLWRAALAAGLVCGIGLLPWLTDTDPALTVLKARAVDRDPTPQVLEDIRGQLGLADGPLHLLGQWLSGLPQGDAGRSWISGEEVTPAVLQALGASLLLVTVALVVATVTAALICTPTLRRTRRAPARSGSAMLAALPEFLTASVLATVVGVQLGWLPALGWYGLKWTILPALALGLPAGAVLGRLLDDLLPAAFAETWAKAATARGVPGGRIARHAVRRCLPGLLPNLGLFAVGLTGGSVVVEQIFDIPGLGRTTLQAALAQDLPVLQAGTLALVLFAALVTGAARLAARPLLGPALRDGALPTLHRPDPPAHRLPPLLYGGLLVAVVVAGLPRDPLAVDTTRRLQPPSAAHPFGTDALGRDLLARVAHGALDTLLLAGGISLAAYVIGVLLGLVPRLSAPLVDTVNAVPPVLAALLVAAVWGSGASTPALAVTVVAWAPLAAHTSALLAQEKAAVHLASTRALGAGRLHLLRRALLPAILPPVARHAALRLPGNALALATLGFLGLGAQPPSPEWGLLLAENQPYAERAPWAVLAPAAALAVLGALAVTAGGLRGRRTSDPGDPQIPELPEPVRELVAAR
ncbi:ABC transporter permease subunit [Streptomyces acidiscabies]|uniref:ABC transporter permease subunit n=3 Tax=Streptomyces acidiscabies TaxID=42234 RepID=A0AAP6BAL7_9ACTN|nr:ABC transporter permease subunit [Streptomyces acidiscabies]MBP5935706.1 ABC transporter permease subunit [Streptomyces sp. LBUM 1476]MBZ3916400.1 ABC transporter permease subunit [Streptomyces acidiscabies]MDX2961227.1 ABC transporter permease subunit [Streptomyces acidiscabies]MDX3022819.1 ABC transporter permease subunit [Streptomyces acidiscabies]MDX3791934.1 ABC transporter permease subunit [Streptomyces acidiscabies]